jgi:hypothetical protein
MDAHALGVHDTTGELRGEQVGHASITPVLRNPGPTLIGDNAYRGGL